MQYSFEEKLKRADHHLKLAKSEIERWLEDKPWAMTAELQADTGETILSIEVTTEPPAPLIHCIGDCIHNLRASLDHLAYALAIANKVMLTEEESFGISFPIFRERDVRYPDGLTPRGRRRIKHLGDEAQAAINELQPFHAGHDAVSHWLWLLEKLNNIDKHRRLLITTVNLGGIILGVPSRSQIGMWEPYIGPLKGKTELTRLRVSHMDKPQPVQVEFKPSLSVAFVDPPAEGREVLATVEGISRYISDTVFPKLRPLL